MAGLVKALARDVVTAERFSRGMTFDEYVAYTGTPENLAREAGWWLGRVRHDFSGVLRTRYDDIRLTDAQLGAIRWLAAQPGGPAKIVVISGEWSSDCRRDVPALARLAEGGGLELRIYLYHYTEFPAIYHKERLYLAMQVPKRGEATREDTWDRFIRDWRALQESPFYTLWTCAAVDEILSALHERIVIGSPA